MSRTDDEAIVAVCLFAALADGERNEAEREHLRGVFAGLGGDGFPEVYTRVIARKTTLEQEVARLSSPEAQRSAFEMAVCVCDADGKATELEREFLERLRVLCGLDAGEASGIEHRAEALAPDVVTPEPRSAPAAPPPGGASAAPGRTAAGAAPGEAALGGSPGTPRPDDAEIEQLITKAAVLAGGLELLPERLATLAVLPVQTKLVYDIGRRYGFELDAGHVRELLATVGVGMASQVIERFARGLLGGVLRGALGGLIGGALGGVAGEATGMATSFASTWAIGQVARRYYAQGRQMSADDLREEFQRCVQRAKELQARYSSDIEARAKTIDLGKLFPGGGPGRAS